MATKIVTKNSSTGGSAPSASDLVQGELAVNVTDKRLYTENNAGAIVELGTNPLGAVTMASTLGVTGVLTANAGVVVDNFTLDGTTLALSSGDLTLDVAGDIILDADGADVIFKDGGTSFLEIDKDGNNARIKNPISDGDVLLQGNDGGSIITALSLDMSAAGTATFNHDIQMADAALLRMGAGGDLILTSDGTNGSIFANEGNLTLDAAGDIILDADGGDITLKDGGTAIGSIGNSGGAAFYGGTNGGLMFNGVNINPTNGTATRVDNANDIGAASYRFKSLYLSGGVYLGGTSTPNFLDDYEEGTWTVSIEAQSGTQPTIGYQSREGNYTKIGNTVHITGAFALNAMTDGADTTFLIAGLPFTIDHICVGSHTGSALTMALGQYELSNYAADAKLGFLGQGSSGSGWAWLNINTLLGSNSSLRFSLTYITDQ